MIISRTPYRISFFGGGTDYPAWYSREGGAVLSTTINKYCYITCRSLPPFFGLRHRVVWSHIEHTNTFAEILHPAIRACLPFLGFNEQEGLEIHHQGDLPARSGIGSSSSFSVGLINALCGFRGMMLSKRALAMKAVHFEQNVLQECVGSQDQMAAAYGGFNRFDFLESGEIVRHPILLSAQRKRDLEARLMLFYLGENRLGHQLAVKHVAQLEQNAAHLRRMHRMVDAAVEILTDDHDLDAFGELLHEAWLLKRSLTDGVATAHVHKTYEAARAAGALGGKLLGAGGTGFMVFYVPPERQAAVREAMENYIYVPFEMENSGSTIIYYESSSETRLPAVATGSETEEPKLAFA